jgi:hypothetical protein|tara:strand:+ start:125434 stop:126069 length:636 start_codon:yes stop_codon:yes gene_type:complete
MTHRYAPTLPFLAAALLAVSACGPSGEGAPQETPTAPAEPENRAEPQPPAADLPALIPPAPGEVGGLPDDRSPLDEMTPIEPGSAEAAGQVLQRYGAHLEEGDFAAAHALWRRDGEASGMSAEEFAESLGKYSERHLLIGRPGRVEGAAGSSYVDVPVQMYGRLQNGDPFNLRGPIRLKRTNDVPGSSEEDRRWGIDDSELKPLGVTVEAE